MTVQLKETPSSKSKAPTAGPSEDDRFGAGPVGSNLEARILKGDIVDGRMRILIARGAQHGVHVGMEGHVKVAGTTLATFQIDEVKPSISYAFVDLTLDKLGANAVAVINPTTSSSTPITNTLRSRVIHVSGEGSTVRVTIARGSDHGIHRGMAGALVADSGHELDFTVEGVDASRSYTTVHKTVDEVNNHQQVIFRPITSQRSPVQRRAASSASTADVQATADAGVASASSRLPHFDAIQRSFGKHDLSSIQSQVGGAATAASASLGAQAYATGNRVAFASSPDLHTAAHEAAHTIQQRHGAVGFQGLGAADDEHEHHADAVADAVVAGQSAEPLLDKLVGGNPTTAIQRRKPKHDVPSKLLKGARDSAALIRRTEAKVPLQLRSLQASREAADPRQMNRTISDLELLRVLLETAIVGVEAGREGAPIDEQQAFDEVIQLASQRLHEIASSPMDRARGQAAQLERVANGPLAQLPQSPKPSSPVETRERAAKLAPLGLCDDPTMQSADSAACPLHKEQREVLRKRVSESAVAIADNWRAIVGEKKLEHRLKPLLERGGLNPFLEILLTATFSWIGGAAMKMMRRQEAVDGAAALGQLAETAANKATLKPEDKLLLGMFQKASGALLATSKGKTDKGEALFDALDAPVTAWKTSTLGDLQQLTDPSLVALGESLADSPYTKEFFREKVTKLLANFDEVQKIGRGTLDQQPALVAVRVQHPTGAVRIALAYPTTKTLANRAPKLGLEPGEDTREVRDGNYRFHKWVDAALVSTVPNVASAPMLSSTDSRWYGKHESPEIPKELARWHANPRDANDVKMFAAGTNPFVPKGSS